MFTARWFDYLQLCVGIGTALYCESVGIGTATIYLVQVLIPHLFGPAMFHIVSAHTEILRL